MTLRVRPRINNKVLKRYVNLTQRQQQFPSFAARLWGVLFIHKAKGEKY